MYRKDTQGNKIPVVLNEIAPMPVEKFEMKMNEDEKKEGSNKIFLYVALLIGLVIVGGSGYLLYSYSKSKKKEEGFGYRLDF
jgi:hypothetical protein